MRSKLALTIVGICALGAGCNLAKNATRNLSYECQRYTQHCLTHIRDQRVAEAALQEYLGCHADGCNSKEFCAGFKDGFVDQIEYNGTTQAPYYPPRRYWKMQYETAVGHIAIEEWYAGFQAGATAARNGNLHDLVVIPSSSDQFPPHQPPTIQGSDIISGTPRRTQLTPMPSSPAPRESKPQ